VVFGSAKRSFFTNVSEIIGSVNCLIPFNETESGNMTTADLTDYLQTRADECGNKIYSILTDMKLGGCDDSQNESSELSEMKGNLIKSSFVFTPLYKNPRRRSSAINRRPRQSYQPYQPISRRNSQTSSLAYPTSTIPSAPASFRLPRRAKPKLVGYVARQMVQICVQTAEAGLLMDQLVQNNATIYRVRSILPSSSLAILGNAALREAIKNALQQADILLGDMGVKRLSYSIEWSSVTDPHFRSLDPHAFLARLFISKRVVKANVRLVVRYASTKTRVAEETPKPMFIPFGKKV